MRDVALAGQLPLPHEGLLLGPLKHDRRAELVEHRLDAGLFEHLHEPVCVVQAQLDVLLDARVALHRQRVPQVDGRVAVPRPHDGGVPAVQVLDVAAHALDEPEARHDHAARHGRPDELVARDGDRPNRLFERHLGGLLHERNHHAEQRAVTMDVEVALIKAAFVEDGEDLVQVVHGAPHGGSDVDVHDRWAVLVLHQLGPEVRIVHLPAFQRINLDCVHPVHPRRFEHAVVRLHARVEDAVGQRLAAHQDSVQVPLRPAIGHVPPKLFPLDFPELCKPVEHADLELARVHPVVALDERVAQVVDHELLQALERPVVEI